jgi:hypothetical protein
MHCRAVLLFAFSLPLAAQIAADPPPSYYQDSRDRIQSYLSRTWTDPNRLGWMLAGTALDHWQGAPHQWDQSSGSYGMRVASAWGHRMVHNTVQLGFESALQEDSRYRRLGEGRFGKRIVFALSHSMLAWKPDGSVEPMYGRIAAGVVTSAVSSTRHPQSISASALVSGMGWAAVDRAEGNLLTEFTPELKSFGRKTGSHLRIVKRK